MPGTHSPDRRCEFDWLRGAGALLVLGAHAATLFAPWSLPYGSLQRSKLVGEALWLLNPWLMPLFMLLAGAATWYALRKRSPVQFMRERLLRILPPLASGVLLLAPLVIYAMRRSAGEFDGSFLSFYPSFFRGIYPAGNFTLLHFWFLLYLLLYTLLALPLFHYLATERGRRLLAQLALVCERRGSLLVLFGLPLLAVEVGLSQFWPQPEWTALVNDWGRFLFFFIIFVYGFALVAEPRFTHLIARDWPGAALVALAASSLLAAYAWSDTFNPYHDLPRGLSLDYLALHSLSATATWAWLVALLGFGRRFLAFDHPLRRYVSEAALPIYYVHPFVWVPVIALIGQWPLGVLPAVTTSCALTMAGTVALVALLRRLAPIRFLLGLKDETQALKGSPVAANRLLTSSHLSTILIKLL